MLTLLIFLVIAYLCGSIPSAVLVCKYLHLPDPRTQGSGNPGATNVLRFGGKKAAVFVLIADIIKGFIPVIAASFFDIANTPLALVVLAVALGHMFPVFAGFRGGKGVATTFGALLGLSVLLALAAAVTWLIVAAISRYSSLAALVAAISTPFYTLWLAEHSYYLPLIVLAVAVCARHYKNIDNLISGTESKIGQKK